MGVSYAWILEEGAVSLRRVSATGALAAVVLLATVGSARSRAEGSSRIVEAREAFERTRAGEARAAQALESAHEEVGRREAALGSDGALADRFEALQRREAELSRRILEAYKERLVATARPEAERAYLVELRDRWDALAPVRDHLPEGTWEALDAELRALVRRGEERAARAAERLEGIGARLEGLRREREAVRREQEGLPVRLDDGSLDAWQHALLEVDRARAQLEKVQEEAEGAFRVYLAALAAAGPPILQKVEVDAAGHEVYRAAWSLASQDGPEAEARRRELRDLVRGTREQIWEIARSRQELAQGRLELARQMRPLSDRLVSLAAEYGDALTNRVFAEFVVEAGVTLAEVFLTGGAATAARKSADLAETLGEAAVRTARGRLGTAVEEIGAETLERTFQAASREVRDRALAEIVTEDRLWRNRFVEAMVERARRRALERGVGPLTPMREARRGAEATLERVMARGRQLEAVKSAVDTALARTHEGAAWLATADRPRSLGAWSLLVGRKGAAAGTMEAGGGDLVEAAGLSAGMEEAGKVLLSDALEAGIGTLVSSGADGAARALSQAAGEGRWTKIATGAAGFREGVRLPHLKAAIRSPASVLGLVGTTVKAAVGAHFAAQAGRADADFWVRYAELAALYQIYVRALEPDRVLWAMEQDLHAAVAAATAAFEYGLERREANVTRREPQALGALDLDVRLEFSTPLEAPPRVRLGGRDLAVTWRHRGPAARWQGDARWDEEPADRLLELSVEVDSGGTTPPGLDADPATPAVLPLDDYVWAGWERGPDRTHALHVHPRLGPRVGGGGYTSVHQRLRDVADPEPEPGKGTLRTFLYDALGVPSRGVAQVRGDAVDERILHPWHLPPGVYSVTFHGPLPEIRQDAAPVDAASVTTVVARGYGRLRVRRIDPGGALVNEPFFVELPGGEPLLRTVAESADLAPGAYRVRLQSWDEERAGVPAQVTAGRETLLELPTR